MRHVANLRQLNHGSHFRAYALRDGTQALNPFLGVDHAWMSGPTFPPHSHAGFSAVSYLFLDAETGIANQDSAGTKNLIRPGGIHWASAGSGIVHEEVPAEPGKTVHSLQIFVDLPDKHRTAAPFALSLEPEDIPVVDLPGVTVRIPVGVFGDTRSPMVAPTDVTLLDVTLADGAELALPIPAGETLFVMPIRGAIDIDGERYDLNDLKLPVFSAAAAPRTLLLQSLSGTAQVMVFAGAPLTSASI